MKNTEIDSESKYPLIDGIPFVIDRTGRTRNKISTKELAAIATALYLFESSPKHPSLWGMESRVSSLGSD